MSEDFLTRWARLKRQSAIEPTDRGNELRTADAAASAAPEPPAARLSTSASSADGLKPDRSGVDVSSLPAIESIGADSNVAAFLQGGIPEDLTRAALRSAWVSDPAIRDFIGIADNQWDFNAEGTIAGFGSLSAEEYARYVAARILDAEPVTSIAPEERSGEKESDGIVPPATSAAPGTRSAFQPLPSHPMTHESLATSTIASESISGPQRKRTHGSALPK